MHHFASFWKKHFWGGANPPDPTAFSLSRVAGVDVTAGPLARGQYIYGRASKTEQRSARWASWYTWASNFRFFRVIQ